MNSQTCLIVNFASTWAMVGLIWLIQIVHYPLFAKVGESQFPTYSQLHQQLITFVVLPLMFAELITAAWLVVDQPAKIAPTIPYTSFALVIVIWASTFFIQVPQHGALTHEFNEVVHVSLVKGNWIRTIAWTARGFLVAYMVMASMQPLSPGD